MKGLSESMAKFCPALGCRVVHLSCLECEDKLCKQTAVKNNERKAEGEHNSPPERKKIMETSYKPLEPNDDWDTPKYTIPPEVQELVESLNDFFGADPMYFGVDGLALASSLVDKGLVKESEWVYPCKRPLGEKDLALVATTNDVFYVNGIPDDLTERRDSEILCYLPLKRGEYKGG